MVPRRSLQLAAIGWALVGSAVALASLSAVNPDARALVGILSVAFPSCAALASVALGHDRARVAGALLLLSAATPTYFAWPINVPAVVLGIALLCAPSGTVQGCRPDHPEAGPVHEAVPGLVALDP